ncbi:hypothetical protein [Micromonospora tarensis]|uniref:hypothetical protein n=1 Tax=Micromonospora tarensis TaxID=2806100 RepID=UPI001EE48B88|nr:hypothetical protein [Micromonospora tarensis]
MTLPTTNIPPSGPNTGGNDPQAWPATAITVPDLPCGHLPGDGCTVACDYWTGVAWGEYHSPDAYLVDGVFTIPSHAPGLLPVTDPALRGAA